MGQVIVEIGGRNYPLSCRDGEEPHLTNLAATIAAKASTLTVNLGQLSEPRLLLMSALMIADEMHELRQAGSAPAAAPSPAPATDDRLAALVARVEALVGKLDA